MLVYLTLILVYEELAHYFRMRLGSKKCAR